MEARTTSLALEEPDILDSKKFRSGELPVTLLEQAKTKQETAKLGKKTALKKVIIMAKPKLDHKVQTCKDLVAELINSENEEKGLIEIPARGIPCESRKRIATTIQLH